MFVQHRNSLAIPYSVDIRTGLQTGNIRAYVKVNVQRGIHKFRMHCTYMSHSRHARGNTQSATSSCVGL